MCLYMCTCICVCGNIVPTKSTKSRVYMFMYIYKWCPTKATLPPSFTLSFDPRDKIPMRSKCYPTEIYSSLVFHCRSYICKKIIAAFTCFPTKPKSEIRFPDHVITAVYIRFCTFLPLPKFWVRAVCLGKYSNFRFRYLLAESSSG